MTKFSIIFRNDASVECVKISTCNNYGEQDAHFSIENGILYFPELGKANCHDQICINVCFEQ